MSSTSSSSHTPTIIAHAFTDGSCLSNPGPGGWAALILSPCVMDGATTTSASMCGGAEQSTNNRMELTAALRALLSLLDDIRSGVLKQPRGGGGSAQIQLISDSTYVLKGISEWMIGWHRRGWKKKVYKRKKQQQGNNQSVANVDLWKPMYDVVSDLSSLGVRVVCKWVKGHSGHPQNEFVDRLAHAQATQQQRAKVILKK